MLTSNTSGLPALHAAFAKWNRQGRRGDGTETHPLHLRGSGCGARVGGAKGCVGSTFAKLCATGTFETRVNLFIMPWETRSERFAGFLQHPGPEGFTFLVPVRALVACLHFTFSSVSLFHTHCVFLDPPVAFTPPLI